MKKSECEEKYVWRWVWFSVNPSINLLKVNTPKSIVILEAKYCINYLYCERPDNPLCVSLILSYFCQNSPLGERAMIEIFTKISLNPPCLKDSRSPGLLKNITNKMSKMILLVTPFIDLLLLILKTNFFSLSYGGGRMGEAFQAILYLTVQMWKISGQTGKMVLFPQDIWKKAYWYSG